MKNSELFVIGLFVCLFVLVGTVNKWTGTKRRSCWGRRWAFIKKHSESLPSLFAPSVVFPPLSSVFFSIPLPVSTLALLLLLLWCLYKLLKSLECSAGPEVWSLNPWCDSAESLKFVTSVIFIQLKKIASQHCLEKDQRWPNHLYFNYTKAKYGISSSVSPEFVCVPLQDKEGAFIVRDSSTAGTYTVSLYAKSAAGYWHRYILIQLWSTQTSPSLIFNINADH